MNEKSSFVIYRKNILKQNPRLLYAGINDSGEGSTYSTHSHDFCEFLLITAGLGQVTIGNSTFPVKKGDLVIYNRGTLHSEEFDNTQTPKVGVMFAALDNVRIAGLSDDCIIKNEGAVIPTESYYESLVHYFKELVKEVESDQPLHEAVTNHLTQIMLIQILRVATFDYDLTFAKNNAYVEAKEYFDKNYTQIESLDSVCKNLYINKFYLSHLFKQQLGMPPVKYLISKRMQLAKNLLENTEFNVSEIAAKCGYADIGYFCRVFKNCENMTPLQYRFSFRSKQNYVNSLKEEEEDIFSPVSLN